MSRKLRKTIILAKVEPTPGTAATPAAGDALLVSEASFELEYNNPERNLIRPALGHSGTLTGERHVRIAFTCELAPSGTAGTAPAWGALLLACAFAEVTTPGQRVEYTPVSDGLKTLTIVYSVDGVVHTATGCMGNVQIKAQAGERPTLQFSFLGTDSGSQAAAAPSATLTDWQTPEVVMRGLTQTIKLGATYAAGALSGGTELCSRGLELDMANDVQYVALLGCTGADIADRKPAGSVALEVNAAQEVAMRADINANTPTSISLLHGSASGKQVLLHIPRAIRLNPKYDEYQGRLLLSMDFNAEPVAGNDEFRLVCL